MVTEEKKMESSKFEELLGAVPAGKYFFNLISNYFADMGKTEIKIKEADFDPEKKTLNLAFKVKGPDTKMTFKISSKKTEKGMIYAMEFEDESERHIVSYESVKV